MEKERVTQERSFCIYQIFKKVSLISECTDQKNLKMCVIVKVKKIHKCVLRVMRYLRSVCVLRLFHSEFSFLLRILAKLKEKKLFDQDNAKERAKITNLYSKRTHNA
jgi:hypothetical protein